MADAISPFVIRELTGKQRVLVLRGRALPYKPFKLEGEQRAVVTRYPGNPVATVQMIGPAEKPTTITGMWKDKFLKALDFNGQAVAAPQAMAEFGGQALTDARALVAAAEDLRLSAQHLEVTWNEVTRHGIMTGFSQSWDRYEDVTWEMTFEWTSRGEKPLPLRLALPANPEDIASAMQSAYDDLVGSIASSTPFSKAEEWLGTMEEALGTVADGVDELSSIAAQATSAVLTPLGAAARQAAALSGIVASLQQLRDVVQATATIEVTSAVDQLQTTFGAELVAEDYPPISLDYGTTVAAKVYVVDVLQATREMQRVAIAEMERVKMLLDEPDLLAVFVARQDSDLRMVSSTYYGTPDNWRRLMKHNGLRTSRLIAGDLVLVPKFLEGDRDA